jgi:DNA-binding transcriptional ArsR family regulator
MNYSPFVISQPPQLQVTAVQDVVRNGLLSLWALTAEPGLAVDPWVPQTAAQLTTEQRHFTHLLFAAFGAALLPPESYADFASYLDALVDEPGAEFQNRFALALEAFTDAALQAEAAALLTNPRALQQQVVAHLRMLWERWLAAEWKRHAYTLTGMTRMINEMVLSQPRWQASNPVTALRFLLQTEPSDQQLAQLTGVQRIVLLWSPHFLGYCSRLGSHDTLWVIRKFDPQLLRRDPMSRAEVLRPLTALADDIRLRILELLTEHSELRAQELISQLESSQGNVSRHLKQLIAAGFVREERAEGANKRYTIDVAGLPRLCFLLRQLLSAPNVEAVSQQQQTETQLSQVRANAPAPLHDFLDVQGRITRWSSKIKDQQAMMAYVVEKFAVEQSYTEKEVNALLQAWYLDADFVLLRRSLVDAGLLRRTKDGSRYWREVQVTTAPNQPTQETVTPPETSR